MTQPTAPPPLTPEQEERIKAIVRELLPEIIQAVRDAFQADPVFFADPPEE